MIRYALIILAFLALVVYVSYMAARGAVSGRFRTISLVLLGFLLILVGTGLYYNQKYYSVQTVQEEFATEKREILNTIRDHLEFGEFGRAADLAAKYIEVNDPELQRLYVRSREAELLQKIENTDRDNHDLRLKLWRNLYDLTGKADYQKRIEAEKELAARAEEKRILNILQDIPEAHIAQKALGFEILQGLNPGKASYRLKYNDYRQQIETRLQNTLWSNACSRISLTACEHFGYLAIEGQTSAGGKKTGFGEIWGVSQRPKGALISKEGEVAPENGFYYIVHEFETRSPTLHHIESIAVENPYAQNLKK
ncbi:MAG: hypothetical protein K9K64_10675 [Desulfohalobiaceae bacterium]|nr:hypothetical protein [Desulfohalobiaceae bacterium]